MRPTSTRLIFLLLSLMLYWGSSQAAKARIGINTTYYSSTSPVLYPYDTNFIYIKLTNDSLSPLPVFPLIVTVKVRTSYDVLSLSELSRSAGVDSLTWTFLDSTSAGERYVIHSPHLVDTLKIGQSISIKVNIYTKCNILGSTSSISTTFLTDTFSLILKDSVGTLLASSFGVRYNVYFPLFTTSYANTSPDSMRPSGITSYAVPIYASAAGAGACPSLSFTNMSSDRIVYRRIKISNIGHKELEFENGVSYPTRLLIKDLNTDTRMQVIGILDAYGTPVSVSIEHVGSIDQFAVGDTLFGLLQWPRSGIGAPSSPFDINDEMVYYEKIQLSGDICSIGMTSYVSTEWNCKSDSTACSQSANYCNTIYPPNKSADLKFTKSAIRNYCYSGDTSIYSDTITNIGNNTAGNIIIQFRETSADQLTQFFFQNATVNGLPLDTSYVDTMTVSGRLWITIQPDSIHRFELDSGEKLILSWKVVTMVSAGDSCMLNIMDAWESYMFYTGRCDGLTVEGANFFPARVMGGSSITLPTMDNLIGTDDNEYFPTIWPQTARFILGTIDTTQYWPRTPDLSNRHYVCHITVSTDINIYSGDPTSTPYSTSHLADHIRFYRVRGGVPDADPIVPTCITYLPDPPSLVAPTYGRNTDEDRIVAVFDNPGISGKAFDSIFSNMIVDVDLQPHCPNISLTGNSIKLSFEMIPDDTCENLLLNTCTVYEPGIPVFCGEKSVQVQCPGCVISGLYNDVMWLSRMTYGYRDATGVRAGSLPNHVPDSLAPIVFNTVTMSTNYLGADTRKMMYYDLFKARIAAHVELNADFFPNPSDLPNLKTSNYGALAGVQGFEYAYLRMRLNASCFDSVRPVTGMGDTLPACQVRIYAPTSGSPLFDNYTNLNTAAFVLPFNSGWGDRIDPVTHEYIYNFSIARLRAQWDSLHTAPDTLPFDVFYDQMKFYIDCNYRVMGNVGLTPSVGIECNLIGTAYFMLKPENTATPADWAVQMQQDTIFGLESEMAHLCDSVSIHPRTLDLSYLPGYVSAGANNIIDSCADVRWFCINPSSTFSIYGFEWHRAQNYLKTNTPCVLTLTNFPTNGITINNTSGITYLSGSLAQQVFPVEYRNFYVPKKVELHGMQTGMHMETPTKWWDYLPGSHDHDRTVLRTTTIGDTTEIATLSTTSKPYFVDSLLSSVYEDVFRPDDGVRLAYNFRWIKPCNRDTMKLTFFEIDSFPSNNFSSQIRNRLDTFYGRRPLSADTLGNDRYFAFHFTIPPISSYMDYRIERGIAAGGHIMWTIRIDSAYEFINPWVGLTGMHEFRIDSVTYLTSVADTLPRRFNYRPDLDTGRSGADSTPYADTVIVMNGGRNLAGLNISKTDRIIRIYASYSCDSLPCDSSICTPRFYLGNFCDSALLRSVRTTQHGISLDSMLEMSCLEIDSLMPFDYFTPIVNIDAPDTSDFLDDTLCGESVFDFDISNSGLWYLCNNLVYITIPPASGYVYPGPPTAVITYNGVNESVLMTAHGTDSLLLDMTGLTNLPLMYGSTTVRGIPDAAHQDLTHPGTIHIRFTLNTGCQFSYNLEDFIKFDFYGDDGCNPDKIHSPYSYNPILLNPRSEYNQFNTSITAPIPFNNGCVLSNKVEISFINVIDNPYGAQHTGPYNVLHLHLSPCYDLDSIHVHYPSGMDSLISSSSDGSGSYHVSIPPGIHIDSMPALSAWFTVGAECYCDTIITAAMYTERSLVCYDTACGLYELQPDSIPYARILLSAPATAMNTAVDLPTHTVSFSGLSLCTPVWRIDDTIVATIDSFISVNSYGSHCVSLSNTLGAFAPCPADTIEHCFFILPPPPVIGVTSAVTCQSTSLVLSNQPEIYTVPDTLCQKICANSCVKYYALTSDTQVMPDSFRWVVRGALSYSVLTPRGDSIQICWDTAGYGNIRLDMYLDDSLVGFNELCVEIIERPEAIMSSPQDSFLCLGETLNMLDLSTVSSSTIETRIWHWGDGSTDETYTSPVNPSHLFDSTGDYHIVLTVINECGCLDSCSWNIHVQSDPIPVIICGTVACYGDTVSYSTTDSCSPYGWDVIGGSIVSTSSNIVYIVWDDPTAAYGYVLLDGNSCTGVCSDTAMLRVPILQNTYPITLEGNLCGDAMVLLTVPFIAGTEYTWSVVGSSTTRDGDYANEFWVLIDSGTTATITLNYVNTLTGLMCSGSSSVTLTPSLEMSWNAERDMCVGSADTVKLKNALSSTAWKAVAPDGSISTHTGISPWYFTYDQIGTYLFTATDTNSCLPDELLVHVHELPVAIDSIDGDDTVCAGDPQEYTTSLPLSGAQVNWLIVGGSPTSGSGVRISVRWSGTASTWRIGCYAVGTTSPYCSSDTIWKTIYPLIPEMQITGDVIVCENSYEPYQEDYVGADYYRWTIDPSTLGSVSAGDGTRNVDVLWNNIINPTYATLVCELRVCDSVYYDSLHVLINPTLDPEITVGSVCPGQAVRLVCSSADGYAWSSELGTPIGSVSDDEVYYVFDNNGLAPVNVEVRVWVTNPGGCPGVRLGTATVTVPPNPGFTISSDDFCSTGTATLTVNSAFATPTATYTFKDGTGATIIGSVGNTLFINSEDFYTCEIEYEGCTYSASLTIDCPIGGGCPMPASAFLDEDCGEIHAFGNPADPAFCLIGPATYSWELLETGEIQYGQDAVFNVLRAGNYHLRYSVLCDGCEGRSDELVEVPIVARFEIDIACRDVTILNESSWLGVPTHIWDNGNVSIITESPIYNVTWLDAGGTHTVHYTLSDADGNVCEATESIILPALPIAVFSFTDNRCEDIAISFDDLSSGIIRKWYWTFDDGATVDGIQNPDRVFDVPSPPPYRVNLRVTDEVGCTDDVEHNLTIMPNNLTGIIEPPDASICSGSTQDIEFTTLTGTVTHYHWSTLEITSGISVNATGVYFVTVSDISGCEFDGAPKATVEILYGAPAVITGENRYCYPEIVSLHSVNTATSYLWQEGIITKGTARDLDLSAVPVGSHTYTLTTTELGCTSTATYTINVYATPTITTINYLVTACSPYSATLTATISPSPSGTTSLLWSNTMSGTPISVDRPGYYSAIYTDMNGCQARNDVNVPNPPNAMEFPSGCMRVCDTMLPLSVPMGRSYDNWQLYNNAVRIDSGYGIPSFVILEAGVYHMKLTIDGCTITTDDLDVEVIPCTPCSCTLDSMRIDTVKATGDTCKYKFWNRSIPNHCYTIDSTVWRSNYIGRMGKGDSLQYSFPMNGIYHVEAVMYLRNHLTGQSCIIRDTVHIFLRGCITCNCTGTPHLSYSVYSSLENGHCCFLIKDTSVYTPCAIPFKWFWRLNGGTTYSTLVPYTIMCDSQGAISLDVDLRVLSHDTSTLKFDSCILNKNNYDTIKTCGSGLLRKGQWLDPETGISGLLAYPIPFQDILNVSLYSDEQRESFVMLKIYDMEGKVVYLDKHIFTEEVLTIDLSILSDGIYEMQAVDDIGNTYRVKLVKGGR